MYSYELLAYKTLVNPKAMPFSEDPEEQLPDYFLTAETITPKEHVAIQAAAQKWIDSSISKTANVPTDYPYEDFKDVYLYAWEQGLKGCTTFRFNPEAFQGVLVTDKDLENTTYVFELEDGRKIELKGGEEVEYDGETHTANLFDANYCLMLRFERRATTANFDMASHGTHMLRFASCRASSRTYMCVPESRQLRSLAYERRAVPYPVEGLAALCPIP